MNIVGLLGIEETKGTEETESKSSVLSVHSCSFFWIRVKCYAWGWLARLECGKRFHLSKRNCPRRQVTGVDIHVVIAVAVVADGARGAKAALPAEEIGAVGVEIGGRGNLCFVGADVDCRVGLTWQTPLVELRHNTVRAHVEQVGNLAACEIAIVETKLNLPTTCGQSVKIVNYSQDGGPIDDNAS